MVEAKGSLFPLLEREHLRGPGQPWGHGAGGGGCPQEEAWALELRTGPGGLGTGGLSTPSSLHLQR